MTAILAFVKKSGVCFYTDGAAYGEDDGSLLFASQKTSILLHVPCIIACRGSSLLGGLFHAAIAHREPSARTFDGLADSMPEILKQAASAAVKLGSRINLATVYGGWSAQSKCWKLYRAFVAGESLENFDVEIVERGFHIEPTVPLELLAARGLLQNGALDLREGDASAIRYMECQRETPFELAPPVHSEVKYGCIVGCFIQKTVLTHDGATTEIIHRWPDEVGKPLGTRKVSA